MRLWFHRGLGLAVSLVLSCGGTTTRDGKVTIDDLGPVVERNAQDLMQIPGVTGVAVGALDDGTPCILVLVLKDTEEVRSRLPRAIEGHPVQILETGLIEPLAEDSAG